MTREIALERIRALAEAMGRTLAAGEAEQIYATSGGGAALSLAGVSPAALERNERVERVLELALPADAGAFPGGRPPAGLVESVWLATGAAAAIEDREAA